MKKKNIIKFYQDEDNFDEFDDIFVEDIDFDDEDDIVDSALVAKDEDYDFAEIRRKSRKKRLFWTLLPLAILILAIIIITTVIVVKKKKAIKSSAIQDISKYLEVDQKQLKLNSDSTVEIYPDQIKNFDLAQISEKAIKSNDEENIKVSQTLYFQKYGKGDKNKTDNIKNNYLLSGITGDKTSGKYFLRINVSVREPKSNEEPEELVERLYHQDFLVTPNLKELIIVFGTNNTLLYSESKVKFQEFVNNPSQPSHRSVVNTFYDRLAGKGYPIYGNDFDNKNAAPGYKDLYKDAARIDLFDTRRLLDKGNETVVYLNDIFDHNKNIKVSIVEDLNDPNSRVIASKWYSNGEIINKLHLRAFKDKVSLPQGTISYAGQDAKSIDGNYNVSDFFYYDDKHAISFGKESLEIPQEYLEKLAVKKLGETFEYREIRVKPDIDQIKAWIFFDTSSLNANAEKLAPQQKNTGTLANPLVVDLQNINAGLSEDKEYFNKVKQYFSAWEVSELDKNGNKTGVSEMIYYDNPPQYELKKDVVFRPILGNYKLFTFQLPHPDYRPGVDEKDTKFRELTVSLFEKDNVYNKLNIARVEKEDRWDDFKKGENEFEGFFLDENYKNEIKAEDAKLAKDFQYSNNRKKVYLKYRDVVFKSEVKYNGKTPTNQSIKNTYYKTSYNDYMKESDRSDLIAAIPNFRLSDKTLTELNKKRFSGGETLSVDFLSINANIKIVHRKDPREKFPKTSTISDKLPLGEALGKGLYDKILAEIESYRNSNSEFKYYELEEEPIAADGTSTVTENSVLQSYSGYDRDSNTFTFYTKYKRKITNIKVNPQYTSSKDNQTFNKDEKINEKEEIVKIELDGETYNNVKWKDVEKRLRLINPILTGFNEIPINENDINNELRQGLQNAEKDITISPRYNRKIYTITFRDANNLQTNPGFAKCFHGQFLPIKVYGEYMKPKTAADKLGKVFETFIINNNPYDDKQIATYEITGAVDISYRFRQKMAKVRVNLLKTSPANNEPYYQKTNFHDPSNENVRLFRVFEHEVGKEFILKREELLSSVEQGFYLPKEIEEYKLEINSEGNYILNINQKRKKVVLEYYGYLKKDNTRDLLSNGRDESSWYGGYFNPRDGINPDKNAISVKPEFQGTEFNYWVIEQTGERLTNERPLPLGSNTSEYDKQIIKLIPKPSVKTGKINVYYVITDSNTNKTLDDITVSNIDNEVVSLFRKYENKNIFKNYRVVGQNISYEPYHIKKGETWKFDEYESYFLEEYKGFYELVDKSYEEEYATNLRNMTEGIEITQTQNEYKAFIFLKRSPRKISFRLNNDPTKRAWGEDGDITRWYGYMIDTKKDLKNASLDYYKITSYGKTYEKAQAISGPNLIEIADGERFALDNELLEKDIYYLFETQKIETVNVNFYDGKLKYIKESEFAVIGNPITKSDLEIKVELGKTIPELYRYVPLKDNHIFIGWYDSPNNYRNIITDKTIIKNECNLYARWITYEDYLEKVLPENFFEEVSINDALNKARWIGVERANSLKYNELERLANEDRTVVYLPDLTVLKNPLISNDTTISGYNFTNDDFWFKDGMETRMVTKNFPKALTKVDWLIRHIFGLKFNDTLESVVISPNYTFYGERTFKDFTNLKEIISLNLSEDKLSNIAYEVIGTADYQEPYSQDFTNYGEQFYNAKSLTSLDFSERLTAISDRMFYGTSLLSKFNISKNVQEIGSYAFANSGLRDVIFPIINDSDARILKDYAFSGASNIKHLNISAQFLIDGKTPTNKRFMNMESLLTFNIIGPKEPETTLGGVYKPYFSSHDFKDDRNLTYFLNNTDKFYKSKITKIPDFMFENATSLKEIDFTDYNLLNHIGIGAFINNKSFKELNLIIENYKPSKSFVISQYAFYNSGIEKIKFNEATISPDVKVELRPLAFAFSNLDAILRQNSDGSFEETLFPNVDFVGNYISLNTRKDYYRDIENAQSSPFYGTKLKKIVQLGAESIISATFSDVISGLSELEEITLESEQESKSNFRIYDDGAIILSEPDISIKPAILKIGKELQNGVILGQSSNDNECNEKIVYLGGRKNIGKDIIISNMKVAKAKRIQDNGELEYVSYEGWAFSNHAGYYGKKTHNIASMEFKLSYQIGKELFENKDIERRYIIPSGAFYGLNVTGNLILPISTYSEKIEAVKRVSFDKSGKVNTTPIASASPENDCMPLITVSEFGAAFRHNMWPNITTKDYYSVSAWGQDGKAKGQMDKVLIQLDKQDSGFEMLDLADTKEKVLIYKVKNQKDGTTYRSKALVGRIAQANSTYNYEDLLLGYSKNAKIASSPFLQNYNKINNIELKERASAASYILDTYDGYLPYLNIIDSHVGKITLNLESDFYTGYLNNTLNIVNTKVDEIVFDSYIPRFANISKISARGNEIRKITGKNYATFALIDNMSPFYSYDDNRLYASSVTDIFDQTKNTGRIGEIEIPLLYDNFGGPKDAQMAGLFPVAYRNLPAKMIKYLIKGQPKDGAKTDLKLGFMSNDIPQREVSYNMAPHELEIVFDQLTGEDKGFENVEFNFGSFGFRNSELTTLKLTNNSGKTFNTTISNTKNGYNGNASLRLIEVKNFYIPEEDEKNIEFVERLVYYFTKNSNDPVRNTNNILFVIKGSEEINKVIDSKVKLDPYFKNVIYNPLAEIDRETALEYDLTYAIRRDGKAIAIDYKKDSFANGIKENIKIEKEVTYVGTKYPVVGIAPKLFERNDRIKEITFPDSISDYSSSNIFGNNKNLTKVVFGTTYTNLAKNEFLNTPILRDVIFNNKVFIEDFNDFARLIKTSKVINTKNTYTNIFFLNGAYYEKNTNVLVATTKDFTNVENGATKIGDNAFKGNKNINTITLPKTLKVIGKNAFMESGLTGEIKLNDGLEVIEANAFRNTKITIIFIPKTVKYLDANIFSGTSATIRFEHSKSDIIFRDSDQLWKNGFNGKILYDQTP